MEWIDSLIMAFSLYTIIPMPQKEWNFSNIRYVLVFLPLAGATTASISFILRETAGFIGFGESVQAAIITAAPVLLTGGIHLDGFMDTVDALASRREKEKKLEIMKDPHIGSFAAAGCAVFFLLYAAFAYAGGRQAALLMIPASVLSRSMSGIAALTMPSARKGGMLDSVVHGSVKRRNAVILAITGIAASIVLVYAGGAGGAAAVVAGIGIYILYRRMAMKHFGGVTGDLAGFLVQISELTMLVFLSL